MIYKARMQGDGEPKVKVEPRVVMPHMERALHTIERASLRIYLEQITIIEYVSQDEIEAHSTTPQLRPGGIEPPSGPHNVLRQLREPE
jgi:hypothetical protein